MLVEINGDLSNIGCRDVNWIPVAEERSKSHFRNDVVWTFMSFTALGKVETLYLEFSWGKSSEGSFWNSHSYKF
jgi:hypothetical protein